MKRTAIIGDKFGDLTVINTAPPQYNKPRVFLRCVCGNVVDRDIAGLYKPSMFKKSCGCARYQYGGRKRSVQKSYEKEGSFNPIAQKFYLGMM